VPVGPHDHVRGSRDAPLLLVEYGDFQCPHCIAAHGEVKRVLKRMGPTLGFVYRHFPLSTIHPRAHVAAEASEAAGAQRRFWDMHDLLFEHPDQLEDEDLMNYADALDLDIQQFATDLGTGVHAPKVRADFMTGVRSGVNGTPTFFVNGIRHNGAANATTLLHALEAVVAHGRA
jgi:protein-disulfide isomerase